MEEIIQVNATNGQDSSNLTPNPGQELNQILDQNADQDQDATLVVKWKRPYNFEGQEYTEVDLSGLDRLTIQDAIDTQKQLYYKEVAGSMLCETTVAFACAIAAKATRMPIEFFKLMPRSIGRKVQRTILQYINVEHTVENGVMTFCKPYSFEGKVYNDVDLSGLADLTTMQETAAENAIAQEGFVIIEDSFNYLYACVLSSMATHLPEAFFTGLPFRELTKLKLAVNRAANFFE